MLGLPRCSTRTATPFPDTTLFRAETGAAETPRCRDCAGSTHGDYAGGERGGRNSRARAELRSAGHEARSDRRAEDCEPEQGEACEHQDRKSVVSGKSVSVRVDLGGRRNIKTTRTRRNSKQKQQ